MRKSKKKVVWTDKITKILSKNDLNTLQDIVIYQDADGTYQLFNKYVITKTSNGFEVSSHMFDSVHVFFTLKNASAWCIFDRRNKFYESRRVLELDNKLGSVDVDLQVHKRLFERAKTDDARLVFLAKLNEDRVKKKLMTDELTEYTTESKHWQMRRYEQKPV